MDRIVWRNVFAVLALAGVSAGITAGLQAGRFERDAAELRRRYLTVARLEILRGAVRERTPVENVFPPLQRRFARDGGQSRRLRDVEADLLRKSGAGRNDAAARIGEMIVEEHRRSQRDVSRQLVETRRRAGRLAGGGLAALLLSLALTGGGGEPRKIQSDRPLLRPARVSA